MSEPAVQLHDHRAASAAARKVARTALWAGAGLMALKLTVFWVTNSAAVLSDALESILNIVAAAVMVYSLWLSGVPADEDHPYGHGKVEFMTLGLEGGLILCAGVALLVVGVQRLITPVPLQRLDVGVGLLVLINLLSLGLAVYVQRGGRRLGSPVLLADARHLFTDVLSTLGVLAALVLVRWTGIVLLDGAVTLLLAGVIVWTSGRLLRQSADGLMDRIDPDDQRRIEGILDDEVAQGRIRGYHKVRHRHTGAFHWVDMHLQVDGAMSVRQGHDLASRIEYRIERELGQAKATAHVEPAEAAGERDG